MDYTKNKSYYLLWGILFIIGCTTYDEGEQQARYSAIKALEDKIVEDVDTEGMVLIPAGTFYMGADNQQARNDEFPKHQVQVDSFWMDETEVTNAQFSAFVKSTGYVTVAERIIDWEEMKKDLPPGTPKPPDSLLQPGALVFKKTDTPVPLSNFAEWWEWKIGADWKHPTGPNSSIEGKENHPVVQVAYEDALAYAKWAGKRLPTEAEWEWASRGGLTNKIYPWGNDPIEGGDMRANFWQGVFPYENTVRDGFEQTAPVKSFPPNSYGLYDMAGNVWEWCLDWYRNDYYRTVASVLSTNPTGPRSSFDPSEPYTPKRVVRGGSFLCNDTYCSGYRTASRMSSSPDTGLNHTGFRCVVD